LITANQSSVFTPLLTINAVTQSGLAIKMLLSQLGSFACDSSVCYAEALLCCEASSASSFFAIECRSNVVYQLNTHFRNAVSTFTEHIACRITHLIEWCM